MSNNVLNFPQPPRMGNSNQTSPMQTIMNQFMSGMSPMAILNRMGGAQADQARRLISGKNEGQLRQIAMNMASQRGIDLNGLAQQMGIKLPK